MLFHTALFWTFFAIVVGAFYLLPRRSRPLLLLIASYVFYMKWDWRFAGLILLSTAVDYFVGMAMANRRPDQRRLLLLASLTVNLGVLGFYKYFDFFAESLARAIGADPASWTLQLILPVGVSFYTFQSMSYTIDVYRGRIAPERSPVDFALFVAFFPQLVAGPIVRASDFFPQLSKWAAPDGLRLRRAFQLILFGLIKKLVFADRFALIADGYFDAPRAVDSPETAWVGVFAFAMQIFFDFSGYTDIARGCALVLGFEFPVNFERPYLATSITDFWHRWHISLSTWLRDYLYVPLGGNRGGAWRTYRNLLLTMLLGGLWHGAAWTFVAWGAFHGGLLAIERAISGLRWPGRIRRAWQNPWLWAPRAIGTFVVVCVGWVLFRARSFSDARHILETMFDVAIWRRAASGIEPDPTLLLGVGLTLGIALLEERLRILESLLRAPWPVQTAVYLVCLWGLEFFSVLDQSIPYVYFQF